MQTSALTPVNIRRLLVVDDHPLMRYGFAELLQAEPDLAVAATASDATEALAHLRADQFDLAVVDISLRGVSGIDLLQDIRIHWPAMPVLVFSMHDEALYAERALHAGARGYLMKDAPPERIISAIRRVLSGGLYLSETVNARILGRMLHGNRQPSATTGNAVDVLSNRELEVFRLIGRGRGTRDIAQEMHVSVKTVETYRAHIKEKLHLNTAPELMRTAIEWLRVAEG